MDMKASAWVVMMMSSQGIACGDAAERVVEHPPARGEFSGEWEDGCDAYCSAVERCGLDASAWCWQECSDIASTREGCRERLGELLWCGGGLSCEVLLRDVPWSGLVQAAVQDVGHPCHEVASQVGPDCCI